MLRATAARAMSDVADKRVLVPAAAASVMLSCRMLPCRKAGAFHHFPDPPPFLGNISWAVEGHGRDIVDLPERASLSFWEIQQEGWAARKCFRRGGRRAERQAPSITSRTRPPSSETFPGLCRVMVGALWISQNGLPFPSGKSRKRAGRENVSAEGGRRAERQAPSITSRTRPPSSETFPGLWRVMVGTPERASLCAEAFHHFPDPPPSSETFPGLWRVTVGTLWTQEEGWAQRGEVQKGRRLPSTFPGLWRVMVGTLWICQNGLPFPSEKSRKRGRRENVSAEGGGVQKGRRLPSLPGPAPLPRKHFLGCGGSW